MINELKHKNYARSFYIYSLNWNFNVEPIFYVLVKQFPHHFLTCRAMGKKCTNLHLEPQRLLEDKKLRYYNSRLGKCVGVGQDDANRSVASTGNGGTKLKCH